MNLLPKFVRNRFKKQFGEFRVFGSGPTWPDRDYNNFAKETYLKNVIAFRCIDIIAKSVASVDWKIQRQLKDGTVEEIPNHPLSNTIKRPNPRESFSMFMLKQTAYLIIAGNSYTQRIKLETGPQKGMTRELYAKRPDEMYIDLDNGTPSKYVWKPGGTEKESFPINPVTYESDILHVKLFHPTNEIYGASVTEPIAREIDTSNESTDWNKSLLENSARPGMVFTYEGNLDDKQYIRLKKQLIDKYSGGKNSGKNIILEGGAKAQKYSLTPEEMDWTETSREMARRISFGYGVPPILVGIPGDSTFRNYQEARLAFWEETIFFYLQFYKAEFNRWLLPKDEAYLTYDLSSVPAMMAKKQMMFEMLKGIDWLTDNEKRNISGYSDLTGADTLYKPLNLIPIDQTPDV